VTHYHPILNHNNYLTYAKYKLAKLNHNNYLTYAKYKLTVYIYIYRPRTFNLLTKMAFVQQNLAPTSKSRVPTSESRAHLARTSIPHPPLSTSHRRFHGPRIDFHRRLHHLHPILNHNDFTVPLVSSYSIPTPLPG
jgi:hypothetical protein